MLDYIKQIVYKEGYEAHEDGISCLDNPYYVISNIKPYYVVNNIFSKIWDDGWWDAWYKEDDQHA